MKKSQTELTYLRAAAQNATSVGLVLILYDLLLHDLELAITAFKDRDIERRTKEIQHSFLVLQQLEGSLDRENGGEAAKDLTRFYSFLRSKILEAQMKASPEILRQQIELVLDVRQAWEQVNKPSPAPADAGAEQASHLLPQAHSMSTTGDADQVSSMSWTA